MESIVEVRFPSPVKDARINDGAFFERHCNMNKLKNEAGVVDFTSYREGKKYPLLVNGKMMLADLDRLGKLLAHCSHSTQPTNLVRSCWR